MLAHVERPDLEAAVADGSILRLARGRYVLPTASEGQQAAHRLTAVAALRTAAASYGWKLKSQPDRPELIVPRGRRVSAADQTACSIRWRRVAPEERDGWRTSPVRTVIDCRIRPDLLDDELRIIVEGDSQEFHTSRDQIDTDCWRYDELVLDDWLVLRVSWTQAMFRQPWVARVMERAVIKQAHRHGKLTLVKARAFAMGRAIAV